MSVPVTEQFLSAERTQTLLNGKAAVDHTHAGAGGASFEGSQGWSAGEYTYLSLTGQGTQITPTSWVTQGNTDATGTYVDPPISEWAYKEATEDDRLYCKEPGVYIARLYWHISFPNSTPTIVSPTFRARNLDWDPVHYAPVCPARPETYLYEGNHRPVPHTTGHMLSPPYVNDVDDWMGDVFFWWNTEDVLVDGGTYVPGDPTSPVPTIRLDFFKIG